MCVCVCVYVCSNPWNAVPPSQQLGEVDIEKGTFGSPSTMVAQFIFTYSNISESKRWIHACETQLITLPLCPVDVDKFALRLK